MQDQSKIRRAASFGLRGLLGVALALPLATQACDVAEPTGIEELHLVGGIARVPTSDANKGNVTVDGNATDFFTNVDDGAAFAAADDGATTIRNHWGTQASSYTAGYSGFPSGTAIRADVSYRARADTGINATIQVKLYDGATLIASGPSRALTGAYANYTETFAGISVSRANSLRTEVVLNVPGGTGYARCTQMWLEAAFTSADAGTQPGDAGSASDASTADAGQADASSGLDAGPLDAGAQDAWTTLVEAGSCTMPGPVTPRHHAPNANFTNGTFTPASAGFNVADVSSASETSALPNGVVGLVWVGKCNGADAAFVSAMSAFVGTAKVFGFYLMDEPDPTGRYAPLCPAANLKAESDWLHAHIPGSKTYITLMNFNSTKSPTYANTYNPANSNVDLYGLDPYPCRTDFGGACDYPMISAAVNAALSAGIPRAALVPVYQAFGGGGYIDDSGGAYSLPTAAQEAQILASWKAVVPSPAFDYAYSWGSQNNDTALAQSPALQQVFAAHNAAACAR